MSKPESVLPYEWALDPDYLMAAYRADMGVEGKHTLTRTDTGLSCFVVKAGYCMLSSLIPNHSEGVWDVEAWEQFGNWGAIGVWGPKDLGQLSLTLNVKSVTEPPALVTQFSAENTVEARFAHVNLIEFYAALDVVLDLHIASLYTGYLCGLVDGLAFHKVVFSNDPYQGFSLEGSWRGQRIQFASDSYGYASIACTDPLRHNLWVSNLTLLRTAIVSGDEHITHEEITELLEGIPEPFNPIPRVQHGESLLDTTEMFSPMEFAVIFGILVENAELTQHGRITIVSIPDLVVPVPAPFGTLMYGEPKPRTKRLGLFNKVKTRGRKNRG